MGESFDSIIEYQRGHLYQGWGEIWLARDVTFLRAIAWGDGGVTRAMPHPPSGIPPDCSWLFKHRFYVTREVVKEYFDSIYSEPRDGNDNLEKDGDDDEHRPPTLQQYAAAHGEWASREFAKSGRLPPPELTSTGSLTLPQLLENLEASGGSVRDLTPECQAVLAAMTTLAEVFGGDKVRLVFWGGI
jgi:hypothetical protein